MTLFPSAFLPSVQYVSAWLHAENPVVYVGEKYQKQTCRNRSLIASSQGALPLIIPVMNGSSSQLLMTDATIVYTERWQQRYWQSLVSAYQNAPYYEHYEEELKSIWFQQDPLLYEYNHRLMLWLFSMMGISVPVICFEQGEKANTDLLNIDFWKPMGDELSYKQVFSYKIPFVSAVSVLDLLMNKGPEAIYWLFAVKKKRSVGRGLKKD